jgi:hypothetical protein
MCLRDIQYTKCIIICAACVQYLATALFIRFSLLFVYNIMTPSTYSLFLCSTVERTPVTYTMYAVLLFL